MTTVPPELDELPYLVGRAWRLGDGVRAEQILAPEPRDGGRLVADLALLGAPPQIDAGDFLVAGHDFGTGAATRATARALRLAGIGAVIARSFGAIFLRCAVHVGLPPLQVEETAAIKSGDRLRVDVEGHKVVNLSSGDRYVIRNVYGEALDVLRAGGWAEFVALQRGRT